MKLNVHGHKVNLLRNQAVWCLKCHKLSENQSSIAHSWDLQCEMVWDGCWKARSRAVMQVIHETSGFCLSSCFSWCPSVVNGSSEQLCLVLEVRLWARHKNHSQVSGLVKSHRLTTQSCKQFSSHGEVAESETSPLSSFIAKHKWYILDLVCNLNAAINLSTEEHHPNQTALGELQEQCFFKNVKIINLNIFGD